MTQVESFMTLRRKEHEIRQEVNADDAFTQPVRLTGCASIGPGSITRDRFDYTEAVADSWKSQMLLNLVKIRYGDTPVFMGNVRQVVAGDSLERSVGPLRPRRA